MPLVGLSLAPFALYVTTGMPWDSAWLIGLTNEVADTTVVAMPGEFAVTAALKDCSMVGTVDWVDSAPVQVGVGSPSNAAASAMPYWVGVKNALSVTWQMKVNFHLGVVGKLPPAAFRSEERRVGKECTEQCRSR